MTLVVTEGELTFARKYHVEADALATARVALNTIASLPWPEPERVSVLARLCREVQADVGTVLARLIISSAPFRSFEEVIPLIGIADIRAFGLVRALGHFDVGTLSPEAAQLRDAWSLVSALRAENNAFRLELDKLRRLPVNEVPQASRSILRLSDVASSVGSQVGSAEGELRRTLRNGLKLSGCEVTLTGAATSVGEDLALDFSPGTPTTAVGLRYAATASLPIESSVVAIPDVRGYTVRLARRKIEASQLVAVVIASSGNGQVVSSQVPAPGSLLPTGTIVRVLLD